MLMENPFESIKILIVDDDPVIVLLSEKRLEMLGYQATTVTSSQAALDLFRADPDGYALVITDQTMPNMTGEQLAKEWAFADDADCNRRWDSPLYRGDG